MSVSYIISVNNNPNCDPNLNLAKLRAFNNVNNVFDFEILTVAYWLLLTWLWSPAHPEMMVPSAFESTKHPYVTT